jgi:two-component system sensor histidine kinase DesK
VYGGRLAAGPAPDGGWLVSARIPVDPRPPDAGPADTADTADLGGADSPGGAAAALAAQRR